MSRHHAGQVRCAASRRDHDFEPARFGRRAKLSRERRRTMRGYHPTLVRDTKLSQRLVSMTHRVPVRLAPHDHRYEGTGNLIFCLRFFCHPILLLFSLVQRETALAVECVKSFSLDEVVT